MSDKKLDEVLKSLLEDTATTESDDSSGNIFDQGIQQAIPETLQASFSELKDMEIGTQFNAYKIIEHIATGGMGKVYLAQRTDGQYQNQVALKILSTPFPDEQVKARFLRECQTLADLKHPFIISILDAGIDHYQRPWFATDYINGLSITQYAQQHTLSLNEKVSLIKDICQAIDFAHSQKIIHRDLKPANILVQQTHHRIVPKVLDFGIAYRKNDNQLTQEGLTIGTPGYMAPEQIKESLVDERSDIFSLGVVIYELFAETKPFVADSLLEIQNRTLNSEPQKLTHLLKAFPKELQLITDTCLQKKPKDRYQTIPQLLTDLTNWQKGYPITIKKRSLFYTTKTVVLRNKLASALLFLATLSTLSSSVYYAYRINHERQQAIEAKNESDELLSFMLKDLYAQLQEVGRTDILKNVASRSLSQLDKYQFKDNQEMQIKKALGYLNIADVLENEKSIEEAEQAINNSILITNRLLQSNPQDPQVLSIKTRTTATLASIYHLKGKLKESEMLLNEVTNILPPPKFMSDDLLFAYWDFLHSFAWNQMEQGLYANAQKHLDTMMRLVSNSNEMPQESDQWLIRRYRALQTQGWNQLELKDYQQSIHDFKSAITSIRVLLQKQPNHAKFKMHEQLILNQIAYVFLLNEQPGETEKVVRQAINLGTNLNTRLPENKRISRELAYSWSTLGDLQLEKEQLEDAIVSFNHSLQISKNLAQIEPNNQSAQNDLAVDSLGLAKIWLKTGDQTKAKSLFLQAEKAISEIAQKQDASLYYIHTYAWILMYLNKTSQALPYIERLRNSEGWGNRNYHELVKTFPTLKVGTNE